MKLFRLSAPLALAMVALAQTAVLANMVYERAQILRTGREIVLPVRPVDPRDLFRGQYVWLGYDISRVPSHLMEGTPSAGNAAFYVTLEAKDDGSWNAVRLTLNHPGSVDQKQIVLKGRTVHGLSPRRRPEGNLWVRYGIEKYFVPEGEGPKLEALAREKKLAALVAVDGTRQCGHQGYPGRRQAALFRAVVLRWQATRFPRA